MDTLGDATLALIESTLVAGARHVAVLMRHSAREFVPGRHDLHNPLTDEGRALARRFGERLPKSVLLRGYASPADRCVETAALALAGYAAGGGRVTRHRPVEGLGVFYVLDQMRMFRAMQAAGGQVPFLERWFDGHVGADVMMPADLAARLVARVVTGKLSEPLATPAEPPAEPLAEPVTEPVTEPLADPVTEPHLVLCVSHDMTLYLVRNRLLGQSPAADEVAFLDALVFYSDDAGCWVVSSAGARARVDTAI
jgi:broad specificity phosphatase PhoE